MKRAIVIDNKHKYFGLIGMATEINSYGNIMFYPDNGCPYRTCIKGKSIQYI